MGWDTLSAAVPDTLEAQEVSGLDDKFWVQS